jgi:cytochrome c2
MKKYRSTYLLIAMLIVLAMLMAACGDDDGDNDNEDNDNDAAATPTVEVLPTVEMGETEEAGIGATEEADMSATEEADMGATEEAGAMGGTEEAGAAGVGAGDAGNGETLFTSLGCIGCHAVDTADDGTGPSLQGVATRAGERVEGMAPEDYLHQSLVEPEAFVVEGFEPVMPSYADQPEEALNDLVAYLMTLDE